jgi:hypothetical protein
MIFRSSPAFRVAHQNFPSDGHEASAVAVNGE